MMSSFYESNLAALVLLNLALFYYQRRRSSTKPSKPDYEDLLAKELDLEEHTTSDYDGGPKEFVKKYLVGHLLAFAGDWLQVSVHRAPL